MCIGSGSIDNFNLRNESIGICASPPGCDFKGCLSRLTDFVDLPCLLSSLHRSRMLQLELPGASSTCVSGLGTSRRPQERSNCTRYQDHNPFTCLEACGSLECPGNQTADLGGRFNWKDLPATQRHRRRFRQKGKKLVVSCSVLYGENSNLTCDLPHAAHSWRHQDTGPGMHQCYAESAANFFAN